MRSEVVTAVYFASEDEEADDDRRDTLKRFNPTYIDIFTRLSQNNQLTGCSYFEIRSPDTHLRPSWLSSKCLAVLVAEAFTSHLDQCRAHYALKDGVFDGGGKDL
jgi:hypothetical protein